MSPGDEPNVSQANIDAVLAAYAERKDHLVLEATLMEIGHWRLGQEINDQVRAQLFRARELIAFAALAKRRLFQGHFGYCNFDTYAFVIQNYAAGAVGGFSFSTRRRDGGSNYLWDAEEFAFLKPLHVASNAKISLDLSLLDALLRADDQDRVPFEAIVEFGRANTDSADVPIHTELVMVKSAFEFLFSIGTDVNEFVSALTAVLPASSTHDGPMAERWRSARSKGLPDRWRHGPARSDDLPPDALPTGKGAAAIDSCGLSTLTWPSRRSYLPLVIKHQLSQDGHLHLDERDATELECDRGVPDGRPV